jgi:hypothetical protein
MPPARARRRVFGDEGVDEADDEVEVVGADFGDGGEAVAEGHGVGVLLVEMPAP